QCLFERQPGLDERCELAREQREVARRDAAAEREAALAPGVPVLDLRDRDRQQRTLAQELTDVLDGVAFDEAGLFAPLRIERRVFEGSHGSARDQSSRVTRRTSSTVVSPRRTLSRPSSRIEGVMVRA